MLQVHLEGVQQLGVVGHGTKNRRNIVLCHRLTRHLGEQSLDTELGEAHEAVTISRYGGRVRYQRLGPRFPNAGEAHRGATYSENCHATSTRGYLELLGDAL